MRHVPQAGIAAAVLLAALAPAVAGCGSGGGSGEGASGGSGGGGAGSTTVATKAGGGSSGGGSPGRGATGRTSPRPAGARERVKLTVPAALRGGELSRPHELSVPRGWKASVWARPRGARMEAVTPAGDLLVSLPGSGAVIELAGGRMATREKVVLAGLESPQGLAFARRGGSWVLYVGESDQIDAYPWRGRGRVGARRVLAADLPAEEPAGDDNHRQKDVVVGRDGRVYFEVGSSSNASPADRRYDPPRGVIDAVGPDGGKVRVVMRGVRNGEGLAQAPDGTIWTAINDRDEIPYPFHGQAEGQGEAFGRVIRSYVDDHPVDEVARVTQGRDLGWPLCNPEQGRSAPPGSLADVPLIPDAVTNPGGRALDCAKLPPIEVGIPAHSAPLGMSFLAGTKVPAPWSGGAVVAAHGSWDRREPRAPAILWMRWDARERTLRPARTLVAGFQEADGERWGRPVDVVAGPAGALFVSDDTAGAIYKLTPPR